MFNFFSKKIPNTKERQLLISNITSEPSNYICPDCHKNFKKIESFSLNNGIILCKNCADNHKKIFPKYISKIKYCNLNELETNYLIILKEGGNKNFDNFIKNEFPKLQYMTCEILYKTKAIDYYKQFLIYKAFNERKPFKPNSDDAYKESKNAIYYDKEEKNLSFFDKLFKEKKKINEFGDLNDQKLKNIKNTNIKNNSNINNNNKNVSNNDNNNKINNLNINKNNIEQNKNINIIIDNQLENKNNINIKGNINNYPEAVKIEECL